MKIGVCDIDKECMYDTVDMIIMELREHNMSSNVAVIPYPPDWVESDLLEDRFDCDVFITEVILTGSVNGVILAKKINQVSPKCKILFYATRIPAQVDIYEAEHENCILKNKQENRLISYVLDFVKSRLEYDSENTIKVRYDRGEAVLDCHDILYIRLENRVTIYYTKDKTYREYKPLNKIQEHLPDYFIRCHASVIVNKNYIVHHNNSMITMVNGEKIKIGRTYVEGVKKILAYSLYERI